VGWQIRSPRGQPTGPPSTYRQMARFASGSTLFTPGYVRSSTGALARVEPGPDCRCHAVRTRYRSTTSQLRPAFRFCSSRSSDRRPPHPWLKTASPSEGSPPEYARVSSRFPSPAVRDIIPRARCSIVPARSTECAASCIPTFLRKRARYPSSDERCHKDRNKEPMEPSHQGHNIRRPT
jgi:hypothetical protein